MSSARERLLAVSGWQCERSRALLFIFTARRAALAKSDYAVADALLLAQMDVENTLRDRAQGAIEEGVHMLFWGTSFFAPANEASA